MVRLMAKSMATLPDPDFSLCLALISDRIAEEEPFPVLAAAAAAFSRADFTEFWRIKNEQSPLFAAIPVCAACRLL